MTRGRCRHLGNRLSDRKLALFEVGCCHRLWPAIGTKPVRRAVRAAVQLADAAAGPNALLAAFEAVRSRPLRLNIPNRWAAGHAMTADQVLGKG